MNSFKPNREISQELLNDALYCTHELWQLLKSEIDNKDIEGIILSEDLEAVMHQERDFAHKTYEALFELYKERYG